jgi:hypothetical protein
MSGRDGKGLGSAIGWLVFPVVPTVLATTYHGFLSFGIDPRHWDNPERWLLLVGPLFGYAFLAGATARLPDDPGRRGWRSVLRRRAVWVAVGPWFLPALVAGLVLGAGWVMKQVAPRWLEQPAPVRAPGWVGEVLLWTIVYGWAVFAVAALRRARRLGRLWRALRDGLLTAIGFGGSLIGGFWAATELWRSYFFDPRALRVLWIVAPAVALLAGCGPQTVGDVRRGELFDAMLMAWVLGLALLWRWWARPRPGDGDRE